MAGSFATIQTPENADSKSGAKKKQIWEPTSSSNDDSGDGK